MLEFLHWKTCMTLPKINKIESDIIYGFLLQIFSDSELNGETPTPYLFFNQ